MKYFYENDLVKSIQELLAELGYSPGPADGIFGQRTKAAISAFQYELELDITGVPSEELLVALQLAIKYENIAENSYENSSVTTASITWVRHLPRPAPHPGAGGWGQRRGGSLQA